MFVSLIIPCAKHIGISREGEDNPTSCGLRRMPPGITSSGIRETQQNQDYDLCGVIITFLQGHHVSLENIHQSVLLLKQVLNPA
jgi:hypothetical protein